MAPSAGMLTALMLLVVVVVVVVVGTVQGQGQSAREGGTRIIQYIGMHVYSNTILYSVNCEVVMTMT